MNYEPFKMAQFAGQWPNTKADNMHSSNPQPLSWDELSALTQIDLLSTMQKSKLGYESTQGHSKLRSALSQHYHSKATPDDLVLTSGAQEGIFLVMNALLKPDDHVVALSPCFEPLVKVAQDVGAEVSLCELSAEQHWQIDWDRLSHVMRSETKLLVINFPHNPTGTHITLDDLNRLIELCDAHGCWLFSDEVFRGLEHHTEHRLPSATDLYPKAISIGVVSKALALPGIRLGWIATRNKKLISDVMTVKSHLSICQSSLDAELCHTLIPHSQILWQRSVDIIKKNKDVINQQLKNHPTLHWQEPLASATGFIQLKHGLAFDFTRNLVDKESIMLMPNDVFLTDHQGFRMTLGRSHVNHQVNRIMMY